jgi:hypothetical protein
MAIVDLAVIGYPYSAVLVDHGMRASVGEVDNRQPPVPQDEGRILSYTSHPVPDALCMCHPLYHCTVVRGDWQRIYKKPAMLHIAQPQNGVRMTVRGSSTTHTPMVQAAEPGESTDTNIYEQMWQGVEVKAQKTGKILWQDRADNTASPPHLHAYVRVSI